MNEIVFQFILGSIFVIFLILWNYRFILSGLRLESFYSPLEGLVNAILMRILFLIGFISVIMYIYDAQLMKWSQLASPLWLRLLGVPIGLFALVILYCSIKALGSNFSATLIIKKYHSLITTGPYRIIRHPMYVAFSLLWVSYFLLSSNWFIGLFGGMAYGLIFWDRIPKEEQMLINKFGKAYKEYIFKTGKFYPKFVKKKNNIESL